MTLLRSTPSSLVQVRHTKNPSSDGPRGSQDKSMLPVAVQVISTKVALANGPPRPPGPPGPRNPPPRLAAAGTTASAPRAKAVAILEKYMVGCWLCLVFWFGILFRDFVRTIFVALDRFKFEPAEPIVRSAQVERSTNRGCLQQLIYCLYHQGHKRLHYVTKVFIVHTTVDAKCDWNHDSD